MPHDPSRRSYIHSIEVTDSTTGQPIAEANVEHNFPSQPNVTDIKSTDASGMVQLNLEVAHYAFRFTKFGYEENIVELDFHPDRLKNPWQVKLVPIPPPEPSTGDV